MMLLLSCFYEDDKVDVVDNNNGRGANLSPLDRRTILYLGEVEEGEGDNRQQRVWEYDDMVAIGEGQATKSDDFSEKFQTVIDPFLHFQKIILQFFSEKVGTKNFIKGAKSAI